eukprot:CAMPEP_0114295058 /NCGR_PEP_ID=MMETSP0059-20121206/10468_1 /TAXON_ID=36894 /ORGANISM="Pyramimonas parkeae, Strain CCMP726" /LENGTH=102 /DNA_ID=CAMNT_0001416899 /DNA_START=767 /DNA_END=1072 /DNA_ORIENTATION=-
MRLASRLRVACPVSMLSLSREYGAGMAPLLASVRLARRFGRRLKTCLRANPWLSGPETAPSTWAPLTPASTDPPSPALCSQLMSPAPNLDIKSCADSGGCLS